MPQPQIQDEANQIEDNGRAHGRGDADQGVDPVNGSHIVVTAQIIDGAGTAQQQGGDDEREHRKDFLRLFTADLLRLRVLVKGALCLDGVGRDGILIGKLVVGQNLFASGHLLDQLFLFLLLHFQRILYLHAHALVGLNLILIFGRGDLLLGVADLAEQRGVGAGRLGNHLRFQLLVLALQK